MFEFSLPTLVPFRRALAIAAVALIGATGAIAVTAAPASADPVSTTENFGTDGTAIAGWTPSRSSWSVDSGQAHMTSATHGGLLVRQTEASVADASGPFSIEADLTQAASAAAGVWSGLAVNVGDDEGAARRDYMLLRLHQNASGATLQWFRVVDGVVDQTTRLDQNNLNFAGGIAGTPFHVTLSGDAAGGYAATVARGGVTSSYTLPAPTGAAALVGGRFALYNEGMAGTYDDVTLVSRGATVTDAFTAAPATTLDSFSAASAIGGWSAASGAAWTASGGAARSTATDTNAVFLRDSPSSGESFSVSADITPAAGQWGGVVTNGAAGTGGPSFMALRIKPTSAGASWQLLRFTNGVLDANNVVGGDIAGGTGAWHLTLTGSTSGVYTATVERLGAVTATLTREYDQSLVLPAGRLGLYSNTNAVVADDVRTSVIDPATTMSALPTGWQSRIGSWSIAGGMTGGRARATASSPIEQLAVRSDVTLGARFDARVSVLGDATSGTPWAGLVVAATDGSNDDYYVLRYSRGGSWQLIRHKKGVADAPTVEALGTLSSGFDPTRPLVIGVSSEGLGRVALSGVQDGTELIGKEVALRLGRVFVGGHVGLYATNGLADFDDLRVATDSSVPAVTSDAFDRADAPSAGIAWQETRGDWGITANRVSANTESDGPSLVGWTQRRGTWKATKDGVQPVGSWSDLASTMLRRDGVDGGASVSVQADVSIGDAGSTWAGVVLDQSSGADGDSYTMLRINRARAKSELSWQLVRRTPSKEFLLQNGPLSGGALDDVATLRLSSPTLGVYDLSITGSGTPVTATGIGGVAGMPAPTRGGVGLFSDGELATIRNVVVTVDGVSSGTQLVPAPRAVLSRVRGTMTDAPGTVSAQITPASSPAQGAPVWNGVASHLSTTTVTDTTAGRRVSYESLQIAAPYAGQPKGAWRLVRVHDDVETVLTAGVPDATIVAGTAYTLRLTQGRSGGLAYDVSVATRGEAQNEASLVAKVGVGQGTLSGGVWGLTSSGAESSARFDDAAYLATSAPAVTAPSSTLSWTSTATDTMTGYTPTAGQNLETVQLKRVVDGREAPILTSGMSPAPLATITSGNDQYVAYYDENSVLSLAHRSLNETVFTTRTLNQPGDTIRDKDTTIGTDGHNRISMGIDPQGRLHVSGNMHAVGLVYFRSAAPTGGAAADIQSLTRVSTMVDAIAEKQVTYPEFFAIPGTGTTNPQFLFTYRAGESGAGTQRFYSWNGTGWQQKIDLFSSVASMSGGSCPAVSDANAKKDRSYSSYPVSDAPEFIDGKFRMAWVWREGERTTDAMTGLTRGDAARGLRIGYAESTDLTTWKTASGATITQKPCTDGLIAFDNTTPGLIVDDVPVMGGALNGLVGVGLDREGRAVVTYSKLNDPRLAAGTGLPIERYKAGAPGSNQLYAARWDPSAANGAGAWNSVQLSNWSGRWSPFGGGSLQAFPLGISSVSTADAPAGALTLKYNYAGHHATWVLDDASLLVIAERGRASETPWLNDSNVPAGMRWNGTYDSASAPMDQPGWFLAWASYPTVTEANGQSSDNGRPDPLSPQPLTLYRVKR